MAMGGSGQNGNGSGASAGTTATKQTPPIAAKARSLMAPGATTPIPPHLALAALRIALTAAALGLLIGWTSPGAWRMVQSLASGHDVGATLIGPGARGAVSAAISRPQLHFYLCAWATFHLLEFAITARYNPSRLYSDSFLIQNGLAYHIAHICGILEFCVESSLRPQWKAVPSTFVWIGLALLAIGQSARSLAMIHAAGNFSHEVATRKRDDHELVTDGIYAFSRHPSYFGFFYWAVGTQVLLANPIGTFVFTIVLWRFFNHRIQGEEASLNYFFKDTYKSYRAKTYTLIPFIR